MGCNRAAAGLPGGRSVRHWRCSRSGSGQNLQSDSPAMTQVFLHPAVADYFAEYDFREVLASPADGSPADLRRRVMEDYVAEKVILLRHVRADHDRAPLWQVRFPQLWQYKKFQAEELESGLVPARLDPKKRDLCQQVFQGDWGRFHAFEQAFKQVNATLRGVLRELLRSYHVLADAVVWRCAETRVENLHFDLDKGSDQIESVRAYWNIDDIPRIWHTSHALTTLMTSFYDELELQRLAGEPVEEQLRELTVRLLGSWWSRGREQTPRHMALFEPDEIWLSDGRTVPHQVIYGRRVVSTFIRLDMERLPAWHQSLAVRMAQLHRTLQARPAGARLPDQALKGFSIPFGKGGPPRPAGVRKLDLKTEWEELFRESVQQRLVRM
jgi:hypothetical protein